MSFPVRQDTAEKEPPRRKDIRALVYMHAAELQVTRGFERSLLEAAQRQTLLQIAETYPPTVGDWIVATYAEEMNEYAGRVNQHTEKLLNSRPTGFTPPTDEEPWPEMFGRGIAAAVFLIFLWLLFTA